MAVLGFEVLTSSLVTQSLNHWAIIIASVWVRGWMNEWMNELAPACMHAQGYISIHLFKAFIHFMQLKSDLLFFIFINNLCNKPYWTLLTKTFQYNCSNIFGVYTALCICNRFSFFFSWLINHAISDSNVYRLWTVKWLSWINHAHFVRSKPIYYEKIRCKHCALCVIKCL